MTFNTELSRKGPGLLVRDILKAPDGKDSADIISVLDLIARVGPDIAVLQSIDYDHDHIALQLIQDQLALRGVDLPYRFARPPNTGRDTGFDLDRDGRLGRARDKHGFGFYRGQGGIAVLSRFPLAEEDARDFTAVRWAELPEPNWPDDYYTPEEKEVLRLHTIAAWDVPIETPVGRIHLLTSHAGPPVFDGPENRNGLRSGDEISFWRHLIDGTFYSPPSEPFIVIGDFNADPMLGEGAHAAINALRSMDVLQDPAPTGAAGLAHTVDWPDGPGRLRVDYILPSQELQIVGSEVHRTESTSRHAPVTVDLQIRESGNNS